VARRIVASNRALQDPMFWIDTPVNVVSSFDSVFVAKDGKVEKSRPVLAVFNARPFAIEAAGFSRRSESCANLISCCSLLWEWFS